MILVLNGWMKFGERNHGGLLAQLLACKGLYNIYFKFKIGTNLFFFQISYLKDSNVCFVERGSGIR